MVQPIRSRLQGNDGFSLLELIIVVAIIGLLAAVARPAFSSYRNRSQMAALIMTGSSVRSALTALAAEDAHSLYPPSVTIASLDAAGVPLSAANYNLAYTQTGTPLGASYTLVLEQNATGYQLCVTPADTKKTTAGVCS
jgi:prepilin-type N-terminal cleavage/methylation domain-containing protein